MTVSGQPQARSSLVTRVLDIARTEGAASLAQRAGRGLGRQLFSTNASIWFVRDLAEQLAEDRASLPVTCEFLLDDKSRLISWLQVNHATYPWIYFPDEIASAISNRHLFAVFYNREEIIGYVKLGMNRVYIHDFNRSLRLPCDSAMIYDTFVHPDFRGRKLASWFLNRSLERLQELGVRRVFSHIEPWNTPSLRAFGAVGFWPLGTVRFLRVAGVELFCGRGGLPLAGPERVFHWRGANV